MRKSLLACIFIGFLLANAYSQVLGNSKSVGRATGAMITTTLLGGFGLGEFINEDITGGVSFLLLDAGIVTALGISVNFIYPELAIARFNPRAVYKNSFYDKKIQNYALATEILFWSFVGLWGLQFILSAIHLGSVLGIQKQSRTTFNDIQKKQYYASRLNSVKKVSDVLSFDAGGHLGLTLSKSF